MKTKFKDTEIGLIPEDWEVKELGRVVDFKTGKLDSNYAEENGKYPFFTCAPKPLSINSFSFNCEAILLAGNNANGIFHTNYYNGKFDAYQRTYVITSKNNFVFLKYLLYQLNFRLNYLKEISQGTATKFLTMVILNNLNIPIPSLQEQKAIAKILSDIDSKIELLQKQNKTLEAIGQAIFKHWFVDFEVPNEESKPYKSSGGEMVFNEELGKEIPKGWEVKRIGEVCKTFGGGTPNTNEQSYWDGGDIYWATPTDITALSSPIIFDTARKITQSGLEKSSAKMLPLGAVLMTSRATLGHFAISKVPIATNQGFISIVCGDYPSNYFMMYSVKQKIEQIIGFAGGSTYPEINKTAFRSIQIIIPPRELVRKFDKNVESLYNEIYENERENKTLALIRDALLPKLMSGEIRVGS